jgi:hypothetical protein
MAGLDGAVEFSDDYHSEPEHFMDKVTTPGTEIEITPATEHQIQLAFIKNPSRGPNKNDGNDVLLITIDDSANYITINRGEMIYIPGVFATLTVDANNPNVNYEIIVWS